MLAATLERNGHARLPALFDARRCAALAGACVAPDSAGTRNMLTYAWCREVASELLDILTGQNLLPRNAVAVQCTLFDKREDCNWQVPLHQDLTIPVADRVEHPALSGWSHKEGSWFVQPPVDVLSNMLALRLHLDRCPETQGALRIMEGSHQHGRLDAAAIAQLRNLNTETLCEMGAGDAHLIRPLLLHASSKASQPTHRRVLHFLFGPATPPFKLTWPAYHVSRAQAAA